MTPIYIDCAEHGIVVDEGFIEISGNASISFEGSKTNCPKCGRMSPIVDVDYVARRGRPTSVELHLTSEQFVRFAQTVAKAQTLLDEGVSEKVVERRLLEDADAEDPELGKLVRWLRRTPGTKVAAWVAALASVAALVQNQFHEGGATPDQIHQIYQDVLREQRERPSQSPTPTPPPPTQSTRQPPSSEPDSASTPPP